MYNQDMRELLDRAGERITVDLPVPLTARELARMERELTPVIRNLYDGLVCDVKITTKEVSYRQYWFDSHIYKKYDDQPEFQLKYCRGLARNTRYFTQHVLTHYRIIKQK